MAIFGIDLGTTYSCIAHVDETGRPVIAKNAVGEDTTPSVVYFESPDNVVVGADAKGSAKLDPDRVVSLIKRRMGEKVELDFDGVQHSPESISAIIVKELARAAAESTHEEVHKVVITVPAYFGVAEREATRRAGTIGGLEVLSLVPEPVAAALYYDAISTDQERTILVYDLGGGTFDTTVIRLEGSDIRVVCTDGDHRLGGADWDAKIADYLLDRFMAENPDSEAADSEEFLQELALAAEDLKKRLSSTQSRRHNMRHEGKAVQVELTRETFEELTADLLDKTFKITERTIETAKSQEGITAFDEVLLVGGSVRMPAVAEGLRKHFGFEPKLHDPDLAVAKGAAQYGLIEAIKVMLPGEDGTGSSAEASETAVNEVADRLGIDPVKVRGLAGKRVTSVVPRAFGVKALEEQDGEQRYVIAHLLKANTALPASTEPELFGTAHPNQTGISIEIWEQAGAKESEELTSNNKIGDGEISGLPPLPQGSPVQITFHMDELGTLTVNAVELTTMKDLEIKVLIEGLSDEEIKQAQMAVSRYSLSE